MALAIAEAFTREGNTFMAHAIITRVTQPAAKPTFWQRLRSTWC